MLSFLLVAVLGVSHQLAALVEVPQYPIIDHRLVSPQPLPNVVGPPTVEFVGSIAPGEGIQVFSDSICLSGNCSQGTKTKSKTVVKSEACESGNCGAESFEYHETANYSERPVRRGLFGGLFRGRRCRGGSCR